MEPINPWIVLIAGYIGVASPRDGFALIAVVATVDALVWLLL